MEPATETLYEIRIRPGQRWLNLDIRGLIEYRDLLVMLTQRDFVLKFKQTVLGPTWYVLQPLLTTVVFTIIFNQVARLPTDGLPPVLFYLGGITIWNFFLQNLNSTSNTLLNNESLYGKVYFPRLIVPLAITCNHLFTFVIQLATLLSFIIFFKLKGSHFDPHPIAALLLTPCLLAETAALSLGLGLLLSCFTVKYRDLSQLVGFLLQVWMYATPVIYPASRFPEHLRWIMYLNPVGPIVENFRGLFLGVSAVTPLETAASIVLSIVLFLIGLALFRRTERTFVDLI